MAYALMWACFFSVAFGHIPAHGLPGSALLLLGTFSPGLAAILLTARAQGGAGVRALLRRILIWRVPVR